MGGMTSPSTKLVNLPPPGQMYPGISQMFQGMLQTMGPETGKTLGEAMRTGFPTDVGPGFEAMLQARQRGRQQGAANITESFGAAGLRYGSPTAQALADYEIQGDKDFAQILAEYSRQSSESAATRRMQALGLGASMYQDAATTTYPTAALATGPSVASQVSSAAQSGLGLMFALGLI